MVNEPTGRVLFRLPGLALLSLGMLLFVPVPSLVVSVAPISAVEGEPSPKFPTAYS